MQLHCRFYLTSMQKWRCHIELCSPSILFSSLIHILLIPVSAKKHHTITCMKIFQNLTRNLIKIICKNPAMYGKSNANVWLIFKLCSNAAKRLPNFRATLIIIYISQDFDIWDYETYCLELETWTWKYFIGQVHQGMFPRTATRVATQWKTSLTARFMGPTWGPTGADRNFVIWDSIVFRSFSADVIDNSRAFRSVMVVVKPSDRGPLTSGAIRCLRPLVT